MNTTFYMKRIELMLSADDTWPLSALVGICNLVANRYACRQDCLPTERIAIDWNPIATDTAIVPSDCLRRRINAIGLQLCSKC